MAQDASFKTSGYWNWTAFPIPLLAALMAGLWAIDVRVVWPSPLLNGLSQYSTIALGVAFIVIPGTRQFLALGHLRLLLLCSAVLLMDLGLVAVPFGYMLRLSAAFAIYSTAILISSVCHFTGTALTSYLNIRIKRPATWVWAAYGSCIAIVGLVFWTTLAGHMPVFFIENKGGTLIRNGTVSLSAAILLFTAVILWQTDRRTPLPFLRWYSLGLLLMAVGLVGSLLITVKDCPLHWASRFTQFLGNLYMCAAVWSTRRDGQAEIASTRMVWDPSQFLATLRGKPVQRFGLRYGMATAAVLASLVLRLVINKEMGIDLPPFVTFYPAVMMVAILAGFGPCLVAMTLTILAVEHWFIPSTAQFTNPLLIDRLGLVVFTSITLFIGAVAEFHRRLRDRMSAYEHEIALRESRERLALFASTMFEGLVESQEGRIVDCNPQAAALLGYSIAELKGLDIARLIPPEDRDRVLAIIKYGKESVIEHAVIRKDGTRIMVEAHGRPIFTGDSRRLTALRDITERVQAKELLEQRVAQRTQELDRANRNLQMISECNIAMVHVHDEQELLRRICEAIRRIGQYQLAWVGYVATDETKSLRPMAWNCAENHDWGPVLRSWCIEFPDLRPTRPCIQAQEARLTSDIETEWEQDPWRGEALQHGFRSSLAIPLLWRDQVLGALTLYSDQPGIFDETQVQHLTETVNDLTIGIVSIRTQSESAHRAMRLRALASELVKAEQRERHKLAKILHDNIQQLLVAAKYGLANISTFISVEKGQNMCSRVADLLDQAIRDSRMLASELSPPILHEKGLGAALAFLSQRMSEQHGLIVKVTMDRPYYHLPNELRAFLYEAVRELLFNIVKHAKVRRAQVWVSAIDDSLALVVQDEGVGFDPSRLDHDHGHGFGLFSMRERLSYLGGELSVQSEPGKGSRFTLIVPIKAEPELEVAGQQETKDI